MPSSTLKKRKFSHEASKEKTVTEAIEDSLESALSVERNPVLKFAQSRPSTRLGSLAGINSILGQVRELVFSPVLYPDLYRQLGVRPPCGLLLNGPSGCGKTLLAYAIAGELGLPFFKASGPELIGGTSGESEQMVRNIVSFIFRQIMYKTRLPLGYATASAL